MPAKPQCNELLASIDFPIFDPEDGVPAEEATLTVQCPDGSIVDLLVNLSVIQSRCPLLALAFEETRYGPKHYLENIGQAAVTSFLRHIYMDDYKPASGEQLPLSTMLELFYYAGLYDFSSLLKHLDTDLRTRFAQLTPYAVPELCSAIDFVYSNPPIRSALARKLTEFCVMSFEGLRLGENKDFKQLLYSTPEFHQDICQLNFRRGFCDSGAIAIIRCCHDAPVKFPQPLFNGVMLDELINEMWNDPSVWDTFSERHAADIPKLSTDLVLRLAQKRRVAKARPQEDETSSSEEEGYYVVRKEGSLQQPLAIRSKGTAVPAFPQTPLDKAPIGQECLSAPEADSEDWCDLGATKRGRESETDSDEDWTVIKRRSVSYS